MGRIFKALAVLLILGALGVIGFAYLGDMGPESTETTLEITLPAGEAVGD